MRIFGSIGLLMMASLTQVNAQSPADAQAIKSMCGCYDVRFNYGETFSPDTAYKTRHPKQTAAIEYVTTIEDKPGHIVLQHILDAGEGMIVKHWRQDWDFQNTHLFDFEGDNKWKTLEAGKEQVMGQWTQKVYEVDESPRYSASGTWIHADGRDYWETTCNAPLPRREYTKRSDYNLMRRTNRQEITKYGWLHEQDNEKIIKTAEGEKILVGEKGWNTYTKVDDKQCEKAKAWWKKNADYWAEVRKIWDQELAARKEWSLDRKLDDQKLFDNLLAIAKKDSDTEEADIRAAIKEYLR